MSHWKDIFVGAHTWQYILSEILQFSYVLAQICKNVESVIPCSMMAVWAHICNVPATFFSDIWNEHSDIGLYMHTCVHTYTHICLVTYIPNCKHSYLHTFTHTCKNTYLHALNMYMHALMHTYKHTYRYTNSQMCLYINTYLNIWILMTDWYGQTCMFSRYSILTSTHINTKRHSCMSVYIYTCIFTCKHVCIHSCLSGYTHEYTHVTYILVWVAIQCVNKTCHKM